MRALAFLARRFVAGELIHRAKADCNVSVKLTQLGLNLETAIEKFRKAGSELGIV